MSFEIFALFLFILLLLGCLYLYTEQLALRKLLPYTADSIKRHIKILSVVAGEDLDMSEIEKSLYSTELNYNLLNYKSVTQEAILSELEKNVTIFELSSHGLNGAFRIGNATLPVSWLSSALKTSATLDCILLLYCNSYQDLDIVSSSDKTFKVGLVGDVTDTTCILFARYFYYFVGKKYSYENAFKAARLFLPVTEYYRIICR